MSGQRSNLQFTRSQPTGRCAPGGDCGSGTLLMAVVVLLVVVAASVVVLVGAGLTGVQQLRSAADLVALSAAAAQAEGEDPCRTAARIAVANQVELRDCRTAGDLLDFAVTVTVAAPSGSLPGRLGFTARSHAGWVVA